MKNKCPALLEIGKIALNCIFVTLYFIKIFHDVAVLPGYDEAGEMILCSKDYYYSVFDKFLRTDLTYLLWLTIAVIGVSIVISITNIIIHNNRKLGIASHIIFGISAIMFIVLIFVATGIIFYY